MQAMLVSMLLFMLIVTVFALQNATAVPIRILFWSFQVSLALVIIGAAFAGALFSFVLSFFRERRSSGKALKTEQTIPEENMVSPGTAGTKDGSEASGATDLAD